MQTQLPADPFALMLNPEAVFSAIESSERLGRLKRRVCRPLDKPLLANLQQRDAAAFDKAIDAEPETEVDIEIDTAHPAADPQA
ncbi:hypothetical protein OOT46_22570 [Aquabacterium sp. A7-Y]|uniref:hypothetical protein n=1 Tax=Aquabacterium sp. A7-Y TaxID=1349605 RepID=UPI00223DDD52|nr:hypothetical protein [Aquabacterium sp. A7-Y]MCW7540612.1 hypothetical protein [Aquabacterium sp. A7-Y]